MEIFFAIIAAVWVVAVTYQIIVLMFAAIRITERLEQFEYVSDDDPDGGESEPIPEAKPALKIVGRRNNA